MKCEEDTRIIPPLAKEPSLNEIVPVFLQNLLAIEKTSHCIQHLTHQLPTSHTPRPLLHSTIYIITICIIIIYRYTYI